MLSTWSREGGGRCCDPVPGGGVSGPNYIDSLDESKSRCDCPARASFYIFSGFQVRQIDESRYQEVYPGDNSCPTVRLVEIPSTAICSHAEQSV